MPTASASGTYDVTTATVVSTSGTYDVTTPAPGTVTATTSGTYDVTTPVATVTVNASGLYDVTAGMVTVSAFGQYDVTEAAVNHGRSILFNGVWVPLQRAVFVSGKWRLISDDDPVTPTVPPFGPGTYGAGTYGSGIYGE